MAGALKAAGFNTGAAIMRSMVAPEAWERFVDGLPYEQQDILRRPRIATTWIPLELTNAVNEAVHRELFNSDDEKMVEVGRRAMKEDLSGIYRIFIRVLAPAYIAARAAKLYGTYLRDSGEMRVVAQGEKFVDVRVDGYPIRAPTFWSFLRGNISGAIEMTRVPGVQCKLVDGGGNETFGQFHTTWK